MEVVKVVVERRHRLEFAARRRLLAMARRKPVLLVLSLQLSLAPLQTINHQLIALVVVQRRVAKIPLANKRILSVLVLVVLGAKVKLLVVIYHHWHHRQSRERRRRGDGVRVTQSTGPARRRRRRRRRRSPVVRAATLVAVTVTVAVAHPNSCPRRDDTICLA